MKKESEQAKDLKIIAESNNPYDKVCPKSLNHK